VRNWWTEMWSIGDDAGRTYCGIARTPDGFAVDVFRGDNCIASTIHGTWRAAEDESAVLKRRYRRRSSGGTPSSWHPVAQGGGDLRISA
jgi:hypothetical protein